MVVTLVGVVETSSVARLSIWELFIVVNGDRCFKEKYAQNPTENSAEKKIGLSNTI